MKTKNAPAIAPAHAVVAAPDRDGVHDGVNSFDVELLARLDVVLMERLKAGGFKALSVVPDWFMRVFADTHALGNEFHFAANFAFLDNFLVDAEDFWSHKSLETLKSGPWTEIDAESVEYHLEAFAVWVADRQLLLIERLGTEYSEKETLLQQARDRALQIEARRRAEALLQKARDELEVRVAERTSELVEANQSLQEQIARRQHAEDQIAYLAYHDALTRLPNRALFEVRMTSVLSQAKRLDSMLAVLFVSLDRFKIISDSLGHEAGDYVLQEVAERLKQHLGGDETIACFGGDEFAILLPYVGRSDDAVKAAAAVHDVLKPALDYQDHKIYITPSIGVAICPADGGDATVLLRNAAAALSRSKAEGGNNYQFYHSEIDAEARKRFALESSLRQALQRDELSVFYQPRVDLKTDSVVGMEALVRWHSPESGPISPADFIPLAEETGLIVPLGEWILHTACAQTKRWQEAGLDGLRLSVNLSARQFEHPDLIAMVRQVSANSGLELQHLELEITESSVMKNPEAAIEVLCELRRLGVKIAIDDFGSGYSSLSYLKQLPIDVLKIDRSFIHDVTTAPADAAIVTTIITLAQNLNLITVAEGVALEEQARFLRLLLCDQIQGYFFSPPLESKDFENLVRQNHQSRHASASSESSESDNEPGA